VNELTEKMQAELQQALVDKLAERADMAQVLERIDQEVGAARARFETIAVLGNREKAAEAAEQSLAENTEE
jgi:hypothetical protein